MPAKGWTEFNPKAGMILVAICQPPRKLTHNQIMSLSLRDVSKIMNVSTIFLYEARSHEKAGELEPQNLHVIMLLSYSTSC